MDAQQLAQELLKLTNDKDSIVGNVSRLNADGTVTIVGQGRTVKALPQTAFESGTWVARRVNGVWYAYCKGRVLVNDRQVLYRRSRPTPKKEQKGSIKILYTVLNDEGNWDVFVGGHKLVPEKITTIEGAEATTTNTGISHGYLTNYGDEKKHVVGLVERINTTSTAISGLFIHTHFPNKEYYKQEIPRSHGQDYIGSLETANYQGNYRSSPYVWRGLGYWELQPRYVNWSAYYFSSSSSFETGFARDRDVRNSPHTGKILRRELFYKDQQDSKDFTLSCSFIDNGSDSLSLVNPVNYVQVTHHTPFDIGVWGNPSIDTYNYTPALGTSAINAVAISKEGDYPVNLSWSIDNSNTGNIFLYHDTIFLEKGFTIPILFNSSKTSLLLKNWVNYAFTSMVDALRKTTTGFSDSFYNAKIYVWRDGEIKPIELDESLAQDEVIGNFFGMDYEKTALDTSRRLADGIIYSVSYLNIGRLANMATLSPGDPKLSNMVSNTLYIVEQPTLPAELGDKIDQLNEGAHNWNTSWATDDYVTPLDEDSTMKVNVYQITDEGKIVAAKSRKVNVYSLKIPKPKELGTYRILAASYFPT